MEVETASPKMKTGLGQRDFVYLAIYLIVLVALSVCIHEAVHIIVALFKGIEFSQLEIGFWGINPSVTLPQGLDDNVKTPIFYAGGITAGILLLCFYFIFWFRKYRRNPSRLSWALALTTIVLAAEQVSTGYLEGHYHAAYLYGATTLFSPTHLFTIAWMVIAVLLHLQLYPRERLKIVLHD
ncbi:MAG: hypothetical protein PHS35_03370 [Dehalococcoidales bacterium]|nr:hypothetical protein [Dehalococcoidales bacterium]